jgi:hypothetical protein
LAERRIKGRGWWRDYTITGTVEPKQKRIVLNPEEVVVGEKSDGAAVVDPLAALGRGVILRSIENALSTAFPAGRNESVGGLRTRMEIDQIFGEGPIVEIAGTLEVIGDDQSVPQR